jgi:hypothetical protein
MAAGGSIESGRSFERLDAQTSCPGAGRIGVRGIFMWLEEGVCLPYRGLRSCVRRATCRGPEGIVLPNQAGDRP